MDLKEFNKTVTDSFFNNINQLNTNNLNTDYFFSFYIVSKLMIITLISIHLFYFARYGKNQAPSESFLKIAKMNKK